MQSDLAALISQLQEEYSGLSPERAEAALKLTKQNGRYNLYAAASVLPGREGAPIELRSSSSSERSEQHAEQAVHFDTSTSDAEQASSRTGSKCSSGDEEEWHTTSSDDSDDAYIPARRVNPIGGGAAARPWRNAGGSGCRHAHQHPHSSDDGGNRHKSKESCTGGIDAMAHE